MHKDKKHDKKQVFIPWLTAPVWNTAQPWLIGIDDTDDLESRGTGFRARDLARRLQERQLARLHAVTRHQLFVSPEIPYTSHNSAACLRVDLFAEHFAEVKTFCRDYLIEHSASGADAGLCITALTQVTDVVREFGRRAKVEVLRQTDTEVLAAQQGLYLEGLTGTRQGLIGALAAVGLHSSRDDGRFLWMRGVRDLAPGRYTLAELRQQTAIEEFQTIQGRRIDDGTLYIRPDEWARPVLMGGCAVLLLEENHDDEPGFQWRVAAKEYIKRY